MRNQPTKRQKTKDHFFLSSIPSLHKLLRGSEQFKCLIAYKFATRVVSDWVWVFNNYPFLVKTCSNNSSCCSSTIEFNCLLGNNSANSSQKASALCAYRRTHARKVEIRGFTTEERERPGERVTIQVRDWKLVRVSLWSCAIYLIPLIESWRDSSLSNMRYVTHSKIRISGYSLTGFP